MSMNDNFCHTHLYNSIDKILIMILMGHHTSHLQHLKVVADLRLHRLQRQSRIYAQQQRSNYNNFALYQSKHEFSSMVAWSSAHAFKFTLIKKVWENTHTPPPLPPGLIYEKTYFFIFPWSGSLLANMGLMMLQLQSAAKPKSNSMHRRAWKPAVAVCQISDVNPSASNS